MAVAPTGPVNRRQQLRRPDPADMPQVIFQDALLGRDLRRRIHVLQAASAADTEMRATWLYSAKTFVNKFADLSEGECRFAAIDRILDMLARQCAIDKQRFTFGMGDAAPLVIQCFNNDRHYTFYLIAMRQETRASALDRARPVARAPRRILVDSARL